MSALVGSIEYPAAQQPAAQESYVATALDLLASRAKGPAHQERTSAGVVLGARATWPRSAGSGATWRGADLGGYLAGRQVGEARVALVFSGTVDNLAEFDGSVAATGAAAAALLDAYLTEGDQFVQRLGGSFAIVIHDGRTGRTVAIRDRLGIEPLYYWHSAGAQRLLFASEPKAILADPAFPRLFDTTSLLDLLNSTSRIPGTTVYRDLREVRPGEILVFAEARLRGTRYWSLPGTMAGESAEIDEVVRAVASETVAAVRRRLTPGSGQGFLLSGGLDSSVICASARQALPADTPLHTYSFVYEDAEQDFKPDQLHASIDTPFVTLMRKHLDSDHVEITVPNSGYLEMLERTVRARDMPGVGDLDMALLRLFDAVAGMSREVFSGEGSDDLFGGYPWFAAEWERPSGGFPWLRGTESFRFLAPEIRRSAALREELAHRWCAVDAELAVLPRRGPEQHHMDKVYYMELTRFLPFLLDRVDRMSAAAGLRVQLPFTDHRLVELAWRLPQTVKATGGMEKGVLRKAFEQLLPPAVAWRRKSGFAVGKSPRYLTAMFDYVRDVFIGGSSPVAPLVDVAYLRQFMADGSWADGTFSGPPILPRLVMLDMWARHYRVAYHEA